MTKDKGIPKTKSAHGVSVNYGSYVLLRSTDHGIEFAVYRQLPE